jgi:glycosyltransferase involved in cell wall biosynthesis
LTISVIVPCFNHAQFLDDCIASILSQTYKTWECVIVNDGSTDDTEAVGKAWEAKDTRIKYYHQNNSGLSSARNFGIVRSSGEYILPLDADDKISASYLQEAIGAFQTDPDLKIVYCRAEFFGEKLGEWLLPDFSLHRLAHENMIFCSAVFRKKEWTRVGGYDSNMKYGWEDWEFWINILKDGGQVKRLSFVGFYYRIRNGSMVRALSTEKLNYMYNYINRKHGEFILKELGNPIQLHNEKQFYENELSKVYNSKSFKILQAVLKLFHFKK